MNQAPPPRTRWLWLTLAFGLAAILAWMAPHLLSGQDTHVRIHDHLDADPIQQWRYLHEQNPLWRSGEPNRAFMKGTIPAHPGPDLRVATWAYFVLPPFGAFVFNQIVSRIVALLGMYLLLARLLAHRPLGQPIAATVAILFALLNFYPPLAWTVPILPWLCWSYLAVWQRQDRWWHWLVLAVSPLFSYFLVAPCFLLLLVGCMWLVGGLRGRWDRRLFAALTLTSGLYVAANYELAWHAFGDDFVSQRSQWTVMSTLSETFAGSLRNAFVNFTHGQHNVHTHHKYLLWFLLPTALIAVLSRRKRRPGNPSGVPLQPQSAGLLSEPAFMLPLLIFLCGLFSLIHGFWLFEPFRRWWLSVPTLGMWQGNRFHWLHPLLWYLAFGYGLAFWTRRPWLNRRAGFGRALLLVILIGQAGVLWKRSDHVTSYRKGLPSYRQFFAEDQFARIRDFIGKPQDSYYVASLGLPPSIALYNGFYCLDGYQSDHSLDYHRRFRRIIELELDQNEDIREYYDYWGGRCYLFSSELGIDFMITRDRQVQIDQLRINRAAFRRMGGLYVLSAVSIRQAEAGGLRLLKVFEGNPANSAWIAHLYEVLPANVSAR